MEKMVHKGVEDHAGRAGVKGVDVGQGTGGREDRDVGDAAEVEQNAGDNRVAEEVEVEDGNKRSTLSAGGEIGGAEVGDNGNAEALGEECRLARLPGGSCR